MFSYFFRKVESKISVKKITLSTMPPNNGGKRYKKAKNGGGDGHVAMIDIKEEEGQMIGRVLKSVGDRRFTVYCNDNKERLCRICGSIRKHEWVENGSLVLISKREMNESNEENKLGDILQLIDQSLYGKIKKLPGMNSILFKDIENQDLVKLRKDLADGKDGDDDFFIRTGEEDEDDDEEDEEKEKEEEGTVKPKEFNPEGLKERQKDAAVSRNTAREKKFISLDDL